MALEGEALDELLAQRYDRPETLGFENQENQETMEETMEEEEENEETFGSGPLPGESSHRGRERKLTL